MVWDGILDILSQKKLADDRPIPIRGQEKKSGMCSWHGCDSFEGRFTSLT